MAASVLLNCASCSQLNDYGLHRWKINFRSFRQTNVYKFVCQWGDWYIGKSTQRLQTRIEQHVPSFIRLRNPVTGSPKKKKKSNPSNGSPKKKRKKTTTANKIKLKTKKKRKITVAPPRSAIDEHLRTHAECAAAYEDQWFSIISRGRNSFHLSVLESMHISSTSPPLCRMKKFVYKSSLFFDRYCCWTFGVALCVYVM